MGGYDIATTAAASAAALVVSDHRLEHSSLSDGERLVMFMSESCWDVRVPWLLIMDDEKGEPSEELDGSAMVTSVVVAAKFPTTLKKSAALCSSLVDMMRLILSNNFWRPSRNVLLSSGGAVPAASSDLTNRMQSGAVMGCSSSHLSI